MRMRMRTGQLSFAELNAKHALNMHFQSSHKTSSSAVPILVATMLSLVPYFWSYGTKTFRSKVKSVSKRLY